MGSDRRFTTVLTAWVAALALALFALVHAFDRAGLGAVRVVAFAFAIGAVFGLVRHVSQTNVMLTRFVEALRHNDYAIRLGRSGGAGFDRLADALNGTITRLRAERNQGAEELRFLEALVDDVPVAVLTVDFEHGVCLANKAARRLFDRHDGVRADDYDVYGADFAARLAGEGPDAPELMLLRFSTGSARAIVRTARLERLGATTRVIAVEPVQGTLDSVEAVAQANLVRVLTHEILNSLTPVTSLAGTAAVLLGEEEPDIAEARIAVLTLARRAEGLRRFIDSYRAVAHPPEPRRRRFEAAPFVDELARLFAVEWLDHRLYVDVEPGLVLDADPDLLAQTLINLLRNAAQATGDTGQVRLRAYATRDGGHIVAVEDDGPGVPENLRADIFLPFFTTRANGTGVGLNLVRQIAVAHGWALEVGDSDLGGAALRLIARHPREDVARA
jgi:nitrogen fixation/metabolism regulation signal transduction histidine kinase